MLSTVLVRPVTALRVALASVLVVSGLVFAFAAPASAAPAAPCSCKVKPLPAALKAADLVVTGTVAALDDDSTPESFTLTLNRVYQGKVETGTATFDQSATCPATDLQLGQEWLIVAVQPKAADARPRVSRCSGSRPLTDGALVKVETALGTGSAAPKPPPPTATFTTIETAGPERFRRLAAPGAAMALIGLLGLVVVRRLVRPRS